jgi:hypothetical protein
MERLDSKRTVPCFYHSTESDKISISSASHFLKFLCQPAFDTFAKPLKTTHKPGFVKEPKFTRRSLYWRFLISKTSQKYFIGQIKLFYLTKLWYFVGVLIDLLSDKVYECHIKT